jgi:hypothetical protein
MVPTFTANRSTGEVPNYAPATSPHLRRRHSMRPPDQRHKPTKEFPPPTRRGYALLPSPDPSGSSWWNSLERRSYAGSLSLHRPVSLAGPAPSDGARASRLCQGCLPPSPAFPRIRLPSASLRLLRQAHGGVLSSPRGSQRLVALYIPAPYFERPTGAELRFLRRRVGALPSPVTDLINSTQNPVHRGDRAQIHTPIKEPSPDLCRCRFAELR